MRDRLHGFAIGTAGAFRYEDNQWLDAESAVPLSAPEEAVAEYCLEIGIGMPTFCPVAFYFTDNHRGFLANANGYVGRTNDGGRTWVDITRCLDREEHLDPPFFMKIRIFQDGWGVALDSDGRAQETKDNGVTWERLTESGAFKDMFALDDEKIWLVADTGIYRLNRR